MFDVSVIGGGHAGLEAALASTRLGARTCLVTFETGAIARLSCNPAVGGVGKGHLVREVHSMGGVMGQLADRTGIQFRLLNTSKGPAVRGPRAQVDRELYPRLAQSLLAKSPVEIIEGEVSELLWEGSGSGANCLGVRLSSGEEIRSKATILTTGTFLGAVLHAGHEQTPGGRTGERAAAALSRHLQGRGIPMGRFKTGTPPRLAKDSIDWESLKAQEGDANPTFFCPETRKVQLPQVDCHEVYTNPRAHEIIRQNLHHSPMMAGRIIGRGPRYCPSFEEKVERFADRDRHRLVLEPESLESSEIYLNGASTSLPADVQIAFLRTLEGLADVEMLRPGHAVEYDHVLPGEIQSDLNVRRAPCLYLAGQIMGTTGYEEAAGLGLLAGANAALGALGGGPLVLDRASSYLGVMVDDIVMRGLDEPYRMFTSRAEHRLTLGIDSADLRLSPLAASIGLLSATRGQAAETRARNIETVRERIETTPVGSGKTLADSCRDPRRSLSELVESLPPDFLEELGLTPHEMARTALQAAENIRRDPYLRRQEKALSRIAHRDSHPIPRDLDFRSISGLSREVSERLASARPSTLGQAARLRGVTPAAIQLLDAYIALGERSSVPRGTGGGS